MSYQQRTTDMTSHPDVGEMRERFDRTAAGSGVVALEGLILLAGLFAAISPWVVHFTGNTNLAINNLIVGITIGLIGLALALAPERTGGLAWLAVPLGVWLVISPWVVTTANTASNGAIWSNCFVGGATALLGLMAAGMTVAFRQKARK
ncbi:SPW repeat protein [Streptomyces sp. WMMC500]|uniref:SPW repeat protein n=1 Tax=Streptomyces sp. WMMC500 TaxID=3015154 RepID=UPI00248B0293|nr:SPW repeat protein [Streptomyces sp. WMMC500]WBB63088.1 SPW repeat protein [Streptomyces sp. WMMC500]